MFSKDLASNYSLVLAVAVPLVIVAIVVFLVIRHKR